jgi:Tol biopolymer transport system component
MKQICLQLALFLIPVLFGSAQKQQPEIISPTNADAVISYFQQCPESPDGKKAAFTIFHSPDSMEVVIKIMATGEIISIAKIKGQARHSGAHPVWANNETLIYGSPSEYEIYHHNIESGKATKYVGGQISDYSEKNKKLLFINKNSDRGKVGIYVLDFSTNTSKCLVSVQDVALLKDEIGTKNPVEYWRIDHPYWSPDGKKINFQIKTAKDQSTRKNDYIFYADENGRDIYFIGRKPMHVQWWDNNSVFGHDWQDKMDFHMRRYDLKGKMLEELSGPGCHGAVSPNRNWIVTESWYGSDPIKVFLYQKGETVPAKLLFQQQAVVNGIKFWELRSHIHPAFSRDGKSVYFNGQGSDGKSKVWCYDLSELL